jgi:hypothetical protein
VISNPENDPFLLLYHVVCEIPSVSCLLEFSRTDDRRRMAHTQVDVLRHLPEAVAGIKIDDLDVNHDFKKPCEDCKLANAPQQISRRPMMTATTPLDRVSIL